MHRFLGLCVLLSCLIWRVGNLLEAGEPTKFMMSETEKKILDLTNAQYIATSVSLGGSNTRIKMAVDPNSAVTLPQLTPFTLVR